METLESRLVAAVGRKIDAPVSFVRWIRKVTGDVPVFSVPSEKAEVARRLGLTVE